jgi:RNA polymerase sigma-70 factor, ECF subfamily
LKKTDDILLFQQIKNGKHEAFNELFRRYYTPLCRFAQKLSATDDPEDVVQSVFIHFWDQRKTIQIDKAPIAYLFKAVKLKIYENFRNNQVKSKHLENFAQNPQESEENDANDLDPYMFSCLLWRAVEQLPEKCGEIFRLSRDEGLTYNEIAEHLNISVKTVENQMGTAFKKLRESLYPALKSLGWSHFKTLSILTLVLS